MSPEPIPKTRLQKPMDERIGGDGSNPDGTPRVLLPLLLLHYDFLKSSGETANHASCQRLADSALRWKAEPWHFKSTNE